MGDLLLPETPIPSDHLGKDNLFSATCSDALKSIEEIIDQSTKNAYDFNNLISIVGARGSGKTTVLWSLQKILENNPNSTVFVVKPLLEPRFFTDSNSILQLVISKLFCEFKELSKTTDSIEKSMEINSLFQKLSNYFVFDGNKDTLADSLDALDSFSGLFDITASIRTLVDRLLELESKKSQESGNGKKYTHFLFAIDDIDLDSKNAYKIISQLSKYLRSPNLIFVLAYDLETMDNVILSGKVKELLGAPSYFDYLLHREELLGDISGLLETSKASYLEKLVPERYQIFVKASESQQLIESLWKLLSVLASFGRAQTLQVFGGRKADNVKDIFEIFMNSGSLRHLNQSINIFLDFCNKNPSPEAEALLHSAANASSYLLFQEPVEKMQKENGLSSDLSDYLLTAHNSNTNKAALFHEIEAVLSYSSFGGALPFSSFFPDYVLRQKDYVPLFDTRNGLRAIKGFSVLDPLSFFELVSSLYRLPKVDIENENDRENAQTTVSVFLEYYLGPFDDASGKKLLAKVADNISSFLSGVREDIHQKFIDVLNELRRRKAKAVLYEVRDVLSLGVRYSIISETNPNVINLQKIVESTIAMKTNNPDFQSSVLRVLRLLSSLIENVF